MFPQLFDLAGKVVVVAGADGGAGRVVASGLAAAGASVVQAALDAQPEGGADRVLASAVERLGRLDAFVAVPDIRPMNPPADGRAEELRRALGSDLEGVLGWAHAAARCMAERGGGSIVLIGSVAGQVGVAGLAARGAVATGLDHLVRQLAVEWGPKAVRVNAIDLGLAADGPGADAVRRATPMARCAEHGDAVGPAIFLCSDAAAFVSGVCLPVDGGYTAA